jgi:hypothetical protein
MIGFVHFAEVEGCAEHAAWLETDEDIQDATHTPKQEERHICITLDTVSDGNVYERHIYYSITYLESFDTL